MSELQQSDKRDTPEFAFKNATLEQKAAAFEWLRGQALKEGNPHWFHAAVAMEELNRLARPSIAHAGETPIMDADKWLANQPWHSTGGDRWYSADTVRAAVRQAHLLSMPSARSETHRYVYIYPNGDYTAGRMEAIKLIPEIVYNVRMRPGRAIVVDGVAVYEGINVATDLIDSIISNLDGTTKP